MYLVEWCGFSNLIHFQVVLYSRNVHRADNICHRSVHNQRPEGATLLIARRQKKQQMALFMLQWKMSMTFLGNLWICESTFKMLNTLWRWFSRKWRYSIPNFYLFFWKKTLILFPYIWIIMDLEYVFGKYDHLT